MDPKSEMIDRLFYQTSETMRVYGMYRLATIALFVALLGLPACETSGRRDIGGVLMSFSEWKSIEENESMVRFNGPEKPKILTIRQRTRDNSLTQETIFFVTQAERPSQIYVERAGVRFGLATKQYLKNKRNFIKSANRRYPFFVESKIKEGKNQSGKYLSVAEDTSARLTCVFAQQGKDLESYAGETEAYFEAVVTLFYCERKSERAILNIFDSIQIRS